MAQAITAEPHRHLATMINGEALGAASDRLRPNATGDFLAMSRELTALDDSSLASALDAFLARSIPHRYSSQHSTAKPRLTWFVRNWATRGTFETGLRASQRWTWRGGHLWTRVQTGRTTFDADVTHGGESNLFGLAAGVDWALGKRWLAGAGGGYARGSLTLDGLNESSDYSAPRGFGYAGYTRDRWAAHGGVSLARAAYSRERAFQFVARLPDTFGGGPMFGGVSRNATNDVAGLTTEIWGDWEAPVLLAEWTVRPTASFRYAHYSLPAWREIGAGSLSLSAPSQAIASAQAGVGIHVMRPVGRFRPTVSTTYRRELTDGRTATTIQLLDGSNGLFLVDGLRLATDTFTIRPGMTFRTDQFDLSLALDLRRASLQTRRAIEFGFGF